MNETERATSQCTVKHTKFQPTNEQWRCPKCGAGNESFIIEDSENFECELVHCSDTVNCSACSSGWTGSRVTALIQKKHDLHECPTCKGRGVVPARPIQAAAEEG